MIIWVFSIIYSSTQTILQQAYIVCILILELIWLIYLYTYPLRSLSCNRVEFINQVIIILSILILLLPDLYSIDCSSIYIVQSLLFIPFGHILVLIHIIFILSFYVKKRKGRIRRFWRNRKVVSSESDYFDLYLLSLSYQNW